MFVIVAYVPEDYVQPVIDALAESGAGEIGDYRRCAFTTKGEGTFQPMVGANPFIGSVDEVEVVDEVKVEMICLDEKASKAVKAMIAAHPYETPAYHLYPVLTLDEVEKLDSGQAQ